MQPVLIGIPQDRPGFDRFIGSWLCPFDKTVVIDVGPSRSLPKLLAEDPELSAFNTMASADQEREKFFMGNSIKGYLGFFDQGNR